MAKADDTSSTIHWIWLYDAYKKAVSCFGTEVLAEMQLRKWMASGQLPWFSMSFKGPDADDIARLEREDRESEVLHILPSAAHHNGDPQFWRANLTIWWEKNAAREFSAFGARAMGIKVSDERLLALLPQSIPTATVQEQIAEPAPHAQPVSEHSTEPRPPGAASVRARPLAWTMTQDVIRRLYPEYPPDKVPQSIPTATVQEQVSKLWKEECNARGVSHRKPPGWTTLARHLGRRKKKKG